MAAVHHREPVASIHRGPHVTALVSHLGQRRKHVEAGQGTSGGQEGGRFGRYPGAHIL